MEPLSISMAIIGLMKTAHEVSSTIRKIVSSKKNGCKEIKDVKSTVDTLRSVLLQLQLLLLNHAKVDDRRDSMILLRRWSQRCPLVSGLSQIWIAVLKGWHRMRD
jgi:hypothetical protein